MAIWDRNDNGNRGNMDGFGGRARNLADRAGNMMRQGMDRMQHRGGYDRMDYNAGRGGWNGDSYGAGGYTGQQRGMGYDRDTYRGNNGGMGRDLGYGYGMGDRDEAGRASMNYDRGYQGGGMSRGMGYDRNFHDVDNGDPFGDRQQQTPIRVIRGRGMEAGGNAMRYDRDMNRGDFGDRGMMGRDRGSYDRGFGYGAQGMERGRNDNRDESYRAYQDYSGYSRGLNYEPYYNNDDFGASGAREVGDENFYDSNYRNRRDNDWF